MPEFMITDVVTDKQLVLISFRLKELLEQIMKEMKAHQKDFMMERIIVNITKDNITKDGNLFEISLHDDGDT